MREILFTKRTSEIKTVLVKKSKGRLIYLTVVLTIAQQVFLILLIFFSLFQNLSASPQQSPRHLPPQFEDSQDKRETKITLCSQNLANYGLYRDMKKRIRALTHQEREQKILALTKRFAQAKCDIIGVQEVLGKSERESLEALYELTEQLHALTGERYVPYTGPSRDRTLRLGYLVKRDLFTVKALRSYAQISLPKLNTRQKPRGFSRGPLELTVMHDKTPLEITTINFHLKSKAYDNYDGAKLRWESVRMEQAQALKDIALGFHSSGFRDNNFFLALLGDRNSHYESASGKILSGKISLQNFQQNSTTNAACRVSRSGVPLCSKPVETPPYFISVITDNPATAALHGTYSLGKKSADTSIDETLQIPPDRNKIRWLDDILIPRGDLSFAEQAPNAIHRYSSGILYQYPEASDHALIWVAIDVGGNL